MAVNPKLKQMFESLNENDEATARKLFHEAVVEMARDIYSEMEDEDEDMDMDDFDLDLTDYDDDTMDTEVDPEFDEFDLDFDFDEDELFETGDDDEDEPSMEDDFIDDVEAGDDEGESDDVDVDVDMDSDDDEDERIDDIEDAFEQLKAEFEEIKDMVADEDEEGDYDDDESDDEDQAISDMEYSDDFEDSDEDLTEAEMHNFSKEKDKTVKSDTPLPEKPKMDTKGEPTEFKGKGHKGYSREKAPSSKEFDVKDKVEKSGKNMMKPANTKK